MFDEHVMHLETLEDKHLTYNDLSLTGKRPADMTSATWLEFDDVGSSTYVNNLLRALIIFGVFIFLNGMSLGK